MYLSERSRLFHCHDSYPLVFIPDYIIEKSTDDGNGELLHKLLVRRFRRTKFYRDIS